MNSDKERTLRNLNLLKMGIRPDIVRIGTQGFKHYIIGCLVDWMLDKGIPTNRLNHCIRLVMMADMEHLETAVDAITRAESCENNGYIIREAVFSKRLRADRFLPKTSEIIEIKNSESEKSIKQKQRAYKNMGLTMETIRI